MPDPLLSAKCMVALSARVFVVVAFLHGLGFGVGYEVQVGTEASGLSKVLNENGIAVPQQIAYLRLLEIIRSMQIDVPSPLRQRVEKYLDSAKASDLLDSQTSKPGILVWHFHGVIFLKKDLIFAQYDDGEMFGGDVLLKVIYSGDKVVSMKTLWLS